MTPHVSLLFAGHGATAKSKAGLLEADGQAGRIADVIFVGETVGAGHHPLGGANASGPEPRSTPPPYVMSKPVLLTPPPEALAPPNNPWANGLIAGKRNETYGPNV
jgi:hypothetical protein